MRSVFRTFLSCFSQNVDENQFAVSAGQIRGSAFASNNLSTHTASQPNTDLSDGTKLHGKNDDEIMNNSSNTLRGTRF